MAGWLCQGQPGATAGAASTATLTTGQEGSVRGRTSGSRLVICEGRVISPSPRPLKSDKRGVASARIPRALYRWREKGIDVQYVRNRSGSNASGGREMVQVRLPSRVSVTRVTWSRSMGQEGAVAAALLWRTDSRRASKITYSACCCSSRTGLAKEDA